MTDTPTATPTDHFQQTLAQHWLGQGEADELIAHAQTLIEQNATEPMSHVLLAQAYLRQGKPEAASLAAHTARQLPTTSPHVHLALAELDVQLGMVDSALEQYHKAAALTEEPVTQSSYYRAAGWALLDRDKSYAAHAYRLFQRAHQLHASLDSGLGLLSALIRNVWMLLLLIVCWPLAALWRTPWALLPALLVVVVGVTYLALLLWRSQYKKWLKLTPVFLLACGCLLVANPAMRNTLGLSPLPLSWKFQFKVPLTISLQSHTAEEREQAALAYVQPALIGVSPQILFSQAVRIQELPDLISLGLRFTGSNEFVHVILLTGDFIENRLPNNTRAQPQTVHYIVLAFKAGQREPFLKSHSVTSDAFQKLMELSNQAQ